MFLTREVGGAVGESCGTRNFEAFLNQLYIKCTYCIKGYAVPLSNCSAVTNGMMLTMKCFISFLDSVTLQ